LAGSDDRHLILENRHTGERLALRRVVSGNEVSLELKGSLPPHREGPPMHIHFVEDEEGQIMSGTLSAVVDGRQLTVGPGESTSIPRGIAHRWWNAGNEPVVFEGHARPAVDLDPYLQAVFEIMNAGPDGLPPLYYMAHLALRHRHTQAVLIMPRPIQAVLFRVIVAIGTVLGRYRGTEWPVSSAMPWSAQRRGVIDARHQNGFQCGSKDRPGVAWSRREHDTRCACRHEPAAAILPPLVRERRSPIHSGHVNGANQGHHVRRVPWRL
jgi:mannose-6-phosphate isomerase-like protein (cupin superfamily)